MEGDTRVLQSGGLYCRSTGTNSSSSKVASKLDRVVKKICGTLAFISQEIEYRSWDIMLQCTRCWWCHIWSAVFIFDHPVVRKASLRWKDCRQNFKDVLRTRGAELSGEVGTLLLGVQ